MVGSAKMIETETPLPEAIGFSVSSRTTEPPFFAEIIEAALRLFLPAAPAIF